MTTEKLYSRRSIAGIVFCIFFLSACGTEKKLLPSPAITPKQITKIYPIKKKPKPKEPVISLRDSPRVRRALDYFTGRGKSFVDDGLARKEAYTLMIEEELRALDLPQELANIALLESRFIATARSPSGAVGMWQFMAPTARSLGLSVGLFTDERKDPEKSTKAAVKYLKNLYDEYGDWLLAIASYNAGSSNVKKAIERCGTKDFFKFEQCSGLSNETLNFVSRFIAVTAITRRLDYNGN